LNEQGRNLEENRAMERAQNEEHAIPCGAEHGVDSGVVLPPESRSDYTPALSPGLALRFSSDRAPDLMISHQDELREQRP
jgi:hypothetical protein